MFKAVIHSFRILTEQVKPFDGMSNMFILNVCTTCISEGEEKAYWTDSPLTNDALFPELPYGAPVTPRLTFKNVSI